MDIKPLGATKRINSKLVEINTEDDDERNHSGTGIHIKGMLND